MRCSSPGARPGPLSSTSKRTASPAERQGDAGGAAAVTSGVVEEVGEGAREEGGIGGEGEVAIFGGDGEDGLVEAGAGDGAAQGLLGADLLGGEGGEVDAGGGEEIADELVDLDDLAIDLVEGVRGLAAVARDLGEEADAGEGGAQLVRDGGEELALVVELLLDAGGHVVHGLCDDADLAVLVAAELDAAVEAAAAEIAGDARELVQGAREAPGDAAGRGPQDDAGDEEGEAAPARAGAVGIEADADLARGGRGRGGRDAGGEGGVGARTGEGRDGGAGRVAQLDLHVEVALDGAGEGGALVGAIPHALELAGHEGVGALHLAAVAGAAGAIHEEADGGDRTARDQDGGAEPGEDAAVEAGADVAGGALAEEAAGAGRAPRAKRGP